MPNTWYENLSKGIKDDTNALMTAFGRSPSDDNEYLHVSHVVSVAPDGTEQTLSKTIFNNSFADIEKQKALAINEYDTANRRYSDLLAQSRTAPDKAAYGAEMRQLEAELGQKRQRLTDVSKEYNAYHDRNFNRVTDSITLRSAHPAVNSDLIAGQSVYGWGETAQQLGQEEIAQHQLDASSDPSAAQLRLNEIKKITKNGWFSFNSDATPRETALAEGAARGLRGWGENAEDFAKDELRDLKLQAGSK